MTTPHHEPSELGRYRTALVDLGMHFPLSFWRKLSPDTVAVLREVLPDGAAHVDAAERRGRRARPEFLNYPPPEQPQTRHRVGVCQHANRSRPVYVQLAEVPGVDDVVDLDGQRLRVVEVVYPGSVTGTCDVAPVVLCALDGWQPIDDGGSEVVVEIDASAAVEALDELTATARDLAATERVPGALAGPDHAEPGEAL